MYAESDAGKRENHFDKAQELTNSSSPISTLNVCCCKVFSVIIILIQCNGVIYMESCASPFSNRFCK